MSRKGVNMSMDLSHSTIKYQYALTFAFETKGDFKISRESWVGVITARDNFFAGIKTFVDLESLKQYVDRFCEEAIEGSGPTSIVLGIKEAISNLESSGVGVRVWSEYPGSILCATRIEDEYAAEISAK